MMRDIPEEEIDPEATMEDWPIHEKNDLEMYNNPEKEAKTFKQIERRLKEGKNLDLMEMQLEDADWMP